MWFLSVGPEVCLQLPSDSTSRWTPLLFGYTLPTIWACSGLSPVRARPWRANYRKRLPRNPRKPWFYCVFSKLFDDALNNTWTYCTTTLTKPFCGFMYYFKFDFLVFSTFLSTCCMWYLGYLENWSRFGASALFYTFPQHFLYFFPLPHGHGSFG